MSVHGNHWSFPKLPTPPHGVVTSPVGCAPGVRPQSRFGAGTERSSFPRVGPIHVTPPFVDLNVNTSTFELAGVPFRLSSMTAYRSSAKSPPRRSATTLPYELTRKQLFVDRKSTRLK